MADTWSIQISRRTGQPYLFNSANGASLWEVPAELMGSAVAAQFVAARVQAGGAAPASSPSIMPGQASVAAVAPQPVLQTVPGASSALPHGDEDGDADEVDYSDAGGPDPFAQFYPGLDSVRPLDFRAAAEGICREISAAGERLREKAAAAQAAVGGAGAAALPSSAPAAAAAAAEPPPAPAGSFFLFPDLDGARRFMVTDLAEEFGLKVFSQRDPESGLRRQMVYSPAAKPAEVLAAEAEEAALEAEAKAARAVEAEAVRAAAAAAAASRAAGRGAGGRGGRGRGRGGAAAGKGNLPPSVLAALAAEAERVKPLAPVRDKRSIVEIQEELRREREAAEAAKRQRELERAEAEKAAGAEAADEAAAAGGAGDSHAAKRRRVDGGDE